MSATQPELFPVPTSQLALAVEAFIRASCARGATFRWGAAETNAGRATNDRGIDGWKMRITIHDRLDAPSKFGILVHELAHVLLGHFGTDHDHWWPGRFNLGNASAEIEAESVAHIVAMRFGLRRSSAAYLSGYVAGTAILQGVSVDLIAKVAGEIERMAKGLLPAPKPRPPKSPKKT